MVDATAHEGNKRSIKLCAGFGLDVVQHGNGYVQLLGSLPA